MEEFKNNLVGVLELLAELEVTLAHVGRLGGKIRPLVQSLAGRNLNVLDVHSIRITENGHVRYTTQEEAEKLLNKSRAHLILDSDRRKLRYVPEQGGKPVWIQLRWGWLKVLLVGMSKPGRPFGARRINDQFDGRSEISARTLSHDIAGLTKLIQGGGTRGPYIYRELVGPEVSDSGFGYVFDPRHRYLIIGGQGDWCAPVNSR